MIRNIIKNKVVKNASWIIVGKIIQMILSLFIGLLTARYLGPSNYGLISYAAAYVSFFTCFCTLGINSVIVKELIDNPGEQGMVIGTSLTLRLISTILSAIMILCIVLIVDAGETETILVVLFSSIGVIFHIMEVFNYWFQAKLMSKVTAVATLVGYIITATYRLYLVIMGKNVVFFALASSVDYICIGVLLLWAYKKKNGQRLKFSWDYGKFLLSKSHHFILPALMVSIYGQTDKIMLKYLMGTAEIGYYATAVNLCNMWTFVITAIIDSMYPIIVEAHKQSENEFNRKNKILYASIFYVCTIVSLIFTVFGEFIISILYGNAYLPAVAPLRIVTWYVAFSYLGVARNVWIVCQNRQKHMLKVYLSASISNVILNCIFIPSFGAVGAAIASLIAQVITVLITPFFIPDLKENSQMMIKAIMLKLK